MGLQGPQARGSLPKAEQGLRTRWHGLRRHAGLGRRRAGRGTGCALPSCWNQSWDLEKTGSFPSEPAASPCPGSVQGAGFRLARMGSGLALREGEGISTEHGHAYRCHLAVFSVAVNLQRGLGLNLATSQLGGKSIR